MKNILWLFSILLLCASPATSQTQSVPAEVVVKLRRQAQMTYLNAQVPHDEEYAAAVLSNGSVVYAMASGRGGKLGLPLGIMLLLHTHPYGAQPVPSYADKATAGKIAAPNCVVTATTVWCAMPNGTVVRGELAREASPSARSHPQATRPAKRAQRKQNRQQFVQELLTTLPIHWSPCRLLSASRHACHLAAQNGDGSFGESEHSLRRSIDG